MRTKCGPEANYTTCRLNGTKRDKEFISWPSAHATEAGSAGVFVAFFVQEVFVDKNLLISFASAVLFLGFGVYVGGSRIKDFKHHPDDVTAGLLIGAGVSYFIWTNMKKKIFTVEKKPIEFAPEANEMRDVEQFDES
ncbi:PAP2 superfamily protein [Trichomonas vaginalis G3]|uniref:PAP2 superfamily protein n=1 Tax=Trichomonas vaginalis (strain ATCC PRA-98 / G3) TaxID=412133 RepID=A2DEI4_TRIV3|nr:phosphatidate phosphatase protein [Trichomonas vaginalis G3]EAY21111.1 PAP2 superfamily protein [Trichomonas vaginalis G3]KAI5539960.1 phosphatidate phosphatase protein [Trichomonas vaginalis G3]|eukprot:XP_001582097.1 PAP2 superfamily protein [Trichomonas vaginalis G3]